jgi:hypothetical protein
MLLCDAFHRLDHKMTLQDLCIGIGVVRMTSIEEESKVY